MKQISLLLKRMLDILVAGVLLVILAVPLAVMAILILLDSGRPVLFVQDRAGRNGRPFKIYKFRTMVQNAEETGLGVFTEENDPRITRVGRWLRKWSLDELPQLFNILKGDMSLVGPRPTLLYQVERYDDRQRKRLLVKPGVTGWAQVNGRNSLTWPERIELDVWYVEHWSLWLDLYILFVRTPLVVLRREGVYGQVADEISRVSRPTNGRGPGVSI
jgi:undecaprenyl phosphate N,N'-diacetylbacillosamine 1-phosphate transferase